MHTEVGAVCGLDFDNTIVTYDELLSTIARERGLIESEQIHTKRAIRDRIRALPDGEIEWQKCQAVLYGERIAEARLIDGAAEFITRCGKLGIPVHVVSHKTEYSRYDASRINLQTAAMEWMTAHGFFDAAGLALEPGRIYFASTRREKACRIGELGCTHFIDDLEETFLEPAFPSATERILYEPGRQTPAPDGVALMRTWKEISDYFFGAA